LTLKLTLRPGEAVLVGKVRIVVESRSTSTIFIEGDAPVMREAECVDPAETGALNRMRYVLQQMYLEQDRLGWLAGYYAAAASLLAEMPDKVREIDRISGLVGTDDLWGAVRAARDLSRRIQAVARPLQAA
jgi:flagellar biosynthesis repressor protein FlbT